MATLARWNAAAIDDAGNKMDGASIEVRRESDNGLASVYSDRAGTASLGNPFTAADGGNIGFHVVGGAYKITATLGAVTRTWRYVGIGLGSESDGGGGDVVGPASAVDDRVATFDGATGKLIQDGGETIAQVKAASIPATYLDTDVALTANSDIKVATQKATKAYVDALIAAQDAMVFKGVIDCSANPNYPAADRGHTYRVSVAGKIGGASGPNVEVGDTIICLTDGTASGTHAAVGAQWGIIQTNVDGQVIGPASVTDGRFALFDGATGKLIKQHSGAPGALAVKSTIATADIDADAVTYAKLQNAAATARILARITAGAGDFEEATIAQVLNLLLTAQGDIITRDGSGAIRLAAGTAGQELVTGGAGANPAWSYTPPHYAGYVATRYYNGGLTNLNANGTLALAVNVLYCAPIFVQELHTFDRIAFHVQATGTAVNARVGIYAFANGVPGALVLDAGTVAVGSTGTKTVTISQALARGMYALAIVCDGTVTIMAAAQAQSINHAETIGAPDLSTNTNQYISVAHTYGALPTPFGTPTYTNGIPIVMALRA